MPYEEQRTFVCLSLNIYLDVCRLTKRPEENLSTTTLSCKQLHTGFNDDSEKYRADTWK
jgi:hypothetical protein